MFSASEISRRATRTRRSKGSQQASFWEDDHAGETPGYLSDQLITCIGNKRSFLPQIGAAVERVKARLNKKKIRTFDAFSGSGVVSRYMKQHSDLLITNDMEAYAATTGRCYLRNKSSVNMGQLGEAIDFLNNEATISNLSPGFIEELYAPFDEKTITTRDRVFYSKANAKLLDNYRRLMEQLPSGLLDLVLAPLLSEASIHANTAGVFKGFYKDSRTGIGKFGGSGGDALTRILGRVRLDKPLFSAYECDVMNHNSDANALVHHLPHVDMAYFDPPYNQHPYGSNYFMLNLLVDYQRPAEVSRVSGIPTNWRRSDYNVRRKCQLRLEQLLASTKASFLLVSFNNEGFITPTAMEEMLTKIGKVDKIDIHYNAFRGSRNFLARSIHVVEHMFLVER